MDTIIAGLLMDVAVLVACWLVSVFMSATVAVFIWRYRIESRE